MPQENNMAELLRLMQTMIVKVDDLATDMKVVKSDVRELKTNTARIEQKVDVFSGQFRDVASQAIKDTQRIASLEGRVDILESKSH
jgi:outer membrane murein-binding lipoprotein Lpp